jgi:hypothetical protein
MIGTKVPQPQEQQIINMDEIEALQPCKENAFCGSTTGPKRKEITSRAKK